MLYILSHSEDIKTIGIHTFFKAQATSFVLFLQECIEKAMAIGDKEQVNFFIKRLKQESGYRMTYKNIVTTAGRTIMARVLSGDVAYTGGGNINYMGLGSGNTTPANSDTALVTEAYRNALANATYSSNVVSIDTFFNTSQANAQHYEAGEFIDGTASLNTGTLYSRWLVNENKTNTETLTVQSVYTITQ